MNIFARSFAAAALAGISVSPVMAESLQTAGTQALSVAGRPDRNYQAFYMEETVLPDRSTIRARAFADKAIGVICEWTEHGRSERNEEAAFHIVDRKPKQIGCVRSAAVPEKWREAKILPDPMADAHLAQMGMMLEQNPRAAREAMGRMEAAARMATGTVTQSGAEVTKLREVIYPGNPHAIPNLRITHTWDIAANIVCLQTLEVPREETGDVRRASLQDWGCFPIANKEYLDRVTAAAGMKPV